MNSERKSVLEMTASEARSFFSKPQSYVPMLLPEYFNFEPVLDYAKSELTKHQLSSMIDKDCLLTDEKVNHTVLLNKDARYDWRPVQIIHPFLYINLVNLLTEEQNWSEIISRFQVFQTDKHIECISLPVESVGENNDTAETILHWWEEMEQNSIVKSLMYKYCIRTDITNCYGSIYTHSIDWAIRGKAKAKDGRRNNKALGFRIDRAIEQIQCGQTNGIPQGGVLFNFIAEIVLGYSDMLLASRINKIGNLEDWHIIRYRDDYRVFSNSKETAEQVVKTLSDVLVDLNMHFNSKKTGITSEIIESAIKPDKIYWNSKIPVIMPIIFDGKRKNVQYQLTLQKHLLEILWLSKKIPELR
ncbi:RNA-directed DNA polymerase [Lacticaseibacillus nasuensis]|uniref:RNA-directed DNA polymerase n=1 Tax=Lacticaseibacillus nasuensis TaxID=944671 RepID=UPI000AA7AC0F|nr:RNA-directed DNA polymerase [Lacticaseibacillus nasuensis]